MESKYEYNDDDNNTFMYLPNGFGYRGQFTRNNNQQRKLHAVHCAYVCVYVYLYWYEV